MAVARSAHCSLSRTRVLQHFSNAGWLFPNYNRGYWLGLTNRTLPDGAAYDFQWIDPHSPGPDYSTYSGWGSSDSVQEPHDNGVWHSWLALHPAPFCGLLCIPLGSRWKCRTRQCRQRQPTLPLGLPAGVYLERCAIGSLAYLKDGIWGWMNVNCSAKYVAICRLQVPGYHGSYFIGLRAATRPYFNWMEASAISPWKLDGAFCACLAALVSLTGCRRRPQPKHCCCCWFELPSACVAGAYKHWGMFQ